MILFLETNALHWLRRIFDFNVVKSDGILFLFYGGLSLSDGLV